jgi:hypothetical protein
MDLTLGRFISTSSLVLHTFSNVLHFTSGQPRRQYPL